MTRRVTATRLALSDIRDIAAYIASDNPRVAMTFEEIFFETIESVAAFPFRSRWAGGIELPAGMRVVPIKRPFSRYLVFFRLVSDESIEVVRVLHGARDISKLLSKG